MTETNTIDETPRSARKVYIKTWGCQMNVYDSERMAGLLKPLGYKAVDVPDDADLVILNTCHIREKAAEKVYSELGRLKAHKQAVESQGREMKIAVAGCVAQAEGAEITARAPQVDLVFGPQAYHKLPEMIARAARDKGEVLETGFDVEDKFDTLAAGRVAEGYSAFVTIQEGCDKFCTFCVVPYTRGAEVSRNVDAITAEVRALAAQGLREVTLLGQNVNAWHSAPPVGDDGMGKDTWGLGELCRHLAKIDGIERIRFTTSHPRDMDDGLIAAFGEEEKLMPYLHLPVQSGSDKVLKAMNRGHTGEHYLHLIERIRKVRPDIAVSGDFIVGFPGEGEKEFQATLDLVEHVRYGSAFSFKYSRRPGTPGAGMAKQVAEDVKTERLARLQRVLEDQKNDFNRAQIGRRLAVLLEKKGRNAGQLIGRSPYLQSVHVTAPDHLLGHIVELDITGIKANSLTGSLPQMAEEEMVS
ncbi:tRNA (N6-isopentenyl adenosine(37)-C2)-methylthiotransferase MiaB [Aquisalinus flavus]|uniref:tRNA-2-methylthio-N(6)-dimethylallyladenosine synthase n=1 Tax=Aquisalinus flavus TaxID=1526572 RepID=A0A8J2Y481_9PROT|nr:tRNA (N6-isopentenyl adenosine(37)-C2)-methylthiotransferase MiaB [Aquisalinus flavus]MBD0425452.1 tRNA (N6-isopentenyl adenosine(37)-C2)-methylthiotransferase MiaB [Aquisalinus flavus]UNE48909.1 tRNA (N6-isopentenyl adenosine(37)-C2)-methylthiotransferase MiaB [Aquisalinus flavus]GGD15929.1 tRNA-2-methylthio-N(6)-dimethylallyladenosine synthase [Aquisalinus flavus]